ncbi:MAG: hypothetical protein LBD82_05265 [Deltaproteobacteria bacterium]|jgi:hypothetical protein|nr:hypothetical protein [Deltaproteobacteria bacterium]
MNMFRELLSRDIDDVFLNPDEFAQEITLQGVSMPAALEGPESLLTDGGRAGGREGVTYEMVTLRIKDGVIPRPASGREITFNGEIWFIQRVTPEMGLLTLELYRERG